MQRINRGVTATKQLGKLPDIAAAITACRVQCEQNGLPFHVDALAAALGVPYETMMRYAAGSGEIGRMLKAAVQECTASVVGCALTADPKSHSLWMFYLRNRAGFMDKGDKREIVCEAPVQFIGEERIG